MHETLVRNIVFPVHERLRGRKTNAYYQELRRGHDLSTDELKALRLRKLRALLTHCITNVPHYADSLPVTDAGELRDLTFEDFAGFPIMEKECIRANLSQCLARNYAGRLSKYNTGGSTGSPLVFYTDKEKDARHNAYKLYCRNWFGIRPGDRQVDFWGSPIELEQLHGIREWKDKYLLNHVLLSAFDLSERRQLDYIKFVATYRPRLVYGYPTVLYLLAKQIIDGASLAGHSPSLVVCTAEMLYPHQRDLISQAFGCRVVNEYGSRDGGLISHECTHGKLHVCAQHVYLEVDTTDDNGIGDLLVTNLDAFGMPFVRYRIGDAGSLSTAPCECGMALPVLEQLAGRSNDFLITATGKKLHGLAPMYVIREYGHKLKQFKIVQYPDRSLKIMLACSRDLDSNELSDMERKLHGLLERDLPVQFEMVDGIAPEQSGKYRSIVSMVET